MTITRTAGELHQTDLTPRDFLIGALLAFEDAPSHLDTEIDERKILALQLLVRELCVVVDPSDVDAYAVYGLPPWIVGSVTPASGTGFGRFLNALVQGENGWSVLSHKIDDDLNFDELLLLHEQLERPVATPAGELHSLRNDKVLSVEGNLIDRTIAAASAFGPTRRQVDEIAKVAFGSPNRQMRELGARLGRMDIATRHRDHDDCGIVVGADVSIDKSGSEVDVIVPDLGLVRTTLKVPNWLPTDKTFIEGLERGRKAAIDLLRTVGVENERLEQIGRVVVRIRGILPLTVLSDRSAGLPLALTIISKVSNLSFPRVVATGSFTEHGTLEPMPPLGIRMKLRAVQIDGMNDGLLAYAPQAVSDPDLTLLEDGTLKTACHAMWGEAWDEWSAAVRSKAMERSGMVIGWRDGMHPGALSIHGEQVVVETPQAERLAHRFDESQTPTLVFLAGPAQSGKTWIGQGVEDKLLGNGRWDVLVLRPVTETFPTSDELRPLIEMLTQQRRMGRPLLVILDDLEWGEGAEDVEDDLSELKDLLKISILAIVRWDDSSDWDTLHAVSELAVVGETRLREFTSMLAVAHPHFRDRSSNVGTAARGAGGNLWWLVRLAMIAANRDAPTSYNQLLEEYYNANCADLSEQSRRDVAKVAALSYAGLSAPGWFLSNASDDALRRLGARRNVEGRWRLASRAACESVLTLTTGGRLDLDSRAVRESVETAVAQYVNIGITRDHRDELVGAFERLRGIDHDILSGVLRRCELQLLPWAVSIDHPHALARLFDAVEEDLSPARRRNIVRALVQLLIARASAVNPGELARCLNVLRQHRFMLERPEEDEDDFWTQLVAALKKNLPRIIRARATARARKLLVRALWRMHDQDIDAVLMANADRLLQSDSQIGPAEYRLALEFIDVSRKSVIRNASLPELPSLRMLADHPVSSADGLRTYVSRLLLRLELGLQRTDWDQLVPQLQREIRIALGQSSALEAALTFRLIGEFNRALTVKLFTNTNLAITLIGLLKACSAGEAAELIRTTGKIHGQTARDILYDGGEPRAMLTSIFAKRIQEDGDGKGAGRLLNAALHVDITFGSIEHGFARRLANLLGPGFFEAQFIVDPRTSVLFHLLSGMVAADVALSQTIRNAALEGVVRSIGIGYREWAPRLALLLVSHVEWGDWFTSELSGRLSEDRLLETMTKARTTEALSAFHELGILLSPELPGRFAATPHEKAFTILHGAERPEIITRAANAISQTLRRAGDLFPGRTIVGRLGGDWAHRLTKASSPGDLAEAVRGLTALDPETAHVAVAAVEDLLVSRVHRGLTQQPQSGVELLRAIERAVPGLGISLVERLQKRHGSWDAIMEQIAFEQDPRAQGTTFHLLATLGGMPKERVRRRVFEQWLMRIVAVTTPAGIIALLRMLAAWEMSWACEAAQQVSAHRLSARMRAGAAHDLSKAEELIGALMAADAEPIARRLIDSIKSVQNIPKRLGLNATARLVAGLRVWDPALGAVLAREACALAAETVASNFVLDDVSLWLEVGWTAFNARLYNDTLVVEEMPWHFALAHPTQVTLWGAGWLADCPWIRDTLERALAEVEREPLTYRAWAAAAIITVASEWHRVGPLLSSNLMTWLPAISSTPYHIDALLHVARTRRGPLMQFVLDNIEVFREKMAASNLRLHPARLRIMRSLSQLETAT